MEYEAIPVSNRIQLLGHRPLEMVDDPPDSLKTVQLFALLPQQGVEMVE